MTTTQERSLAAEARAVEAGHHAILDGRTVRVCSDSTPGLHWIVSAECLPAEGAGVIFTCDPEDWAAAEGRGHLHLRSEAPGAVPCMHAALAARRLEREGLIRWERGSWVTTARAAAAIAETLPVVDDPFAGL